MYNECTGTWCKYGNAGVERVNMMGVYSTIFFAYVAGNILNILLNYKPINMNINLF